ncbi:MAG: response regulator [Propionibacteriaceae bacterium]|jgi:DNA-binding response OmpR family regulator|nr:response regulator [Propionibacteriaceae bacterium]
MATILIYSDDRTTREDVRLALGSRIAHTTEPIGYREAATQAAALAILDEGSIDLCVFDAEAVPSGGMGLTKQIREEYDPVPPVLLLVARQADSWLATWSGAAEIHPFPIDPITLPEQIATLWASCPVASTEVDVQAA